MRRVSFKATVVALSLFALSLLALVAYSSRDVIRYKTVAVLEDKDFEKDGLSDLQARAQLDPSDLDSLIRLAHIDIDSGNYSSALERWREINSLSPLDPEARYQLARSLYLSGNVQMAQTVLSDDILVDHSGARLLSVRVTLALGDRAKALSLLESILTRSSVEDDALLLKADLLVAEDELDGAASLYEKLLSSANSQIQMGASIGLVQLYLRKGETAEALARLDTIVESDAQVGVLETVARLYFQARAVDKGLAVYGQLISRQGYRTAWVVDMAEEMAGRGDRAGIIALRNSMQETDFNAVSGRYYLDSLVEYIDAKCDAFLDSISWSTSHSKRPLALWLRLNCAAQNVDSEAFEAASSALNLKLLSSQLKSELYKVLVKRASDISENQNPSAAIAMGNLALQLEEKPIEASLVLATALVKSKEYDRALALVTPFDSDTALGSKAREIGARALMGLKRYDDVNRVFAQLRSEDGIEFPASASYWWGVNAQLSGDDTAAEAHFRDAVRAGYNDRAGVALLGLLMQQERWVEVEESAQWYLNHESTERRAIGQAYLAAVATAKNEYLKAAQHYLQASKLSPQRAPFYLRAADNFIDAGAFDEAEAVLTEASKNVKDKRIVQFKLAYVAEQAKREALAVSRYRELANEYPQWPLPIYNLAAILAQRDADIQEALELSARAYNLDPNWDLAAELYNQLSRRFEASISNKEEAGS